MIAPVSRSWAGGSRHLLAGSHRSRVERVALPDQTVVVKEFLSDDGGFARERAALSIMPVDAPAPRLLDAVTTPPTVVMTISGPARAGRWCGTWPT